MRDRESYDCREYSNIKSTEKNHSGKCVHHFWIEKNLASDWNRFEILQEDRPPRRRAQSRRIRRALPAALHRGRKSRPTPTHRRRLELAVVAMIV